MIIIDDNRILINISLVTQVTCNRYGFADHEGGLILLGRECIYVEVGCIVA